MRLASADFALAFQEHPHLADRFRPRMTKYIPHVPLPKQRAFLLLNHQEAFYGGAVGGGKSDALLMAALQYADIPKYSAIIFRRTLADAKQPNSAMSRSKDWLQGTDARWKPSEYTWYFPSGAKLVFGYLEKEMDKYRYRSAEYSAILWDELTDFHLSDYSFVNHRLRSPRCPWHKKKPDPECPSCKEYAPISKVPLRIRAASNPGGIGHGWVRRRFDIRKVEGMKTSTGHQLYMGQNKKRPHIPAFLCDNPYLDEEEYSDTLSELDPVTRDQLLGGDWGVSAEARFKPKWAQYYLVCEPYIELSHKTFSRSQCGCFCVIDPAASTESAPGTTELRRDKESSWTVIGTFLTTPDGHLIVWDMHRMQGELPDIVRDVSRTVAAHKPQFVGMEYTAISTHAYQYLRAEGFNMKPFRPLTKDKIARSWDICNRFEQGRVWLPQADVEWKRELEDELYVWTGDKRQTDDQVDVMSYAAQFVSHAMPRATGGVPMVFE